MQKHLKQNLFYLLYSAGNAGSIFKAIPAALQNFMETFHILLFEVSIRASAEGFGDVSESLWGQSTNRSDVLQSSGLLSAQSHKEAWWVWFVAPAKTAGSTGVCQETVSSERDWENSSRALEWM